MNYHALWYLFYITGFRKIILQGICILPENLAMKNIILSLILLLSGVISAQELKYEEVVKVDSTITKDELFNRARSWIGKTYNNEKYVISIEDRANGELSGNAIMNYNPTVIFFGVAAVAGEIDYKINIFVKDGRYKYIFDSFRHTGSYVSGSRPISYGIITEQKEAARPSRGSASNKAWRDIKEQISFKTKKTIESLKESMNKKYEGGGDW